MKKLALFGLVALALQTALGQEAKAPVRIALVGLVHDHANGFIPRLRDSKEAQLVGIVEPDQALAGRYADRFKLDRSLFYPSLEALCARTNVQAVAMFTSVFDHRRVVEECAARGIDVMMEKPFAVSLEHAKAMAQAAAKGGIEIVVNYETSWYPSTQAAGEMVRTNAIGDLRKIVAHFGHQGPKEIGCSEDFLKWLTDPTLNGGGVLMDFGCYGADLMTWLMEGKRPVSVFAATQQIKPDVYPNVEDEATIVLTYPKAQGIIQASWNWPFDRKDLEIYGQTGYVFVPKRDTLRVRLAGQTESPLQPPPLAKPMTDPISYLAAVVRKEIKPSGLAGLPINMIATEILDAAKESTVTGKRVYLPSDPPY